MAHMNNDSGIHSLRNNLCNGGHVLNSGIRSKHMYGNKQIVLYIDIMLSPAMVVADRCAAASANVKSEREE